MTDNAYTGRATQLPETWYLINTLELQNKYEFAPYQTGSFYVKAFRCQTALI